MSKSTVVGLQSTGVAAGLSAVVVVVLVKLLNMQFSTGALFGTMASMVFVVSSAAYKQGLKDQQVGQAES